MFSTKRHSEQGRIVATIVLIVCMTIAVIAWLNRQYIVDQLSVWQFQPTEEIATLGKNAGMNSGGIFYFYAAHPSVEDAENFNKKCSRKEMSAAILGCYNGQNIFIYNVKDERLNGVREVTAAHEMLHVVYGRLTETEKSTVNTLLAAEYEKLKNDKEFADRMAFYERTEPGERDNELHSIIGTEVRIISPELDAHYKKYFDDRLKTVSLHEAYASVFANLQKRGEEIAAELTRLAQSIEADSALYNAAVTRLNQNIETFNSKAANGEFSSDSEFRNQRSALLAQAQNLDANRQSINQMIATYNRLRDELATVASESEALSRSIDSSLAPAPSL